MIFQYGYAQLIVDFRPNVMDRDFNIVDKRGFSSIVQGDSILFIDWTFNPVEEPRIINGIDRDTYLIPYTLTHNKDTGELLLFPVTGFKTVTDAFDENLAPDDNFAIPPYYAAWDGFSNGLAPVSINDDKLGFINEEGRPRLNAQFRCSCGRP